MVENPDRGDLRAVQRAVVLGATVALALWLALPAGVAGSPPGSPDGEDDPVLWPERQREFLLDGAGFLLSREERAELLATAPDERQAWIDAFLGRDPAPETKANELELAIASRRRLVEADFLSYLDDRARVLFLHGPPSEKHVIECGQTFEPLEIWRYGEEEIKRSLLFYRDGEGGIYRLWRPLDSKRVLYTREMEYWLEQWEEIRKFTWVRRFDLQSCEETPLVDNATGVEALYGFRKQRPTNTEIERFIAPPKDIARWALGVREDETGTTGELTISAVDIQFPDRVRQRIVTRLFLTVPPEAELGVEAPDEDSDPEHRLTVEGLVEQEGDVFEDFRARFRLPASAEERQPIALAIERALRPGRAYLLRLRVVDEIGGGQTVIANGIRVPAEPEEIEELPVPEDVIVSMGERLAENRLAGRDSLLLAPPNTDVILGVWRADTLISGESIKKVVFLVDGEPQLSKTKPPFSVELRLAEYPREQVIRAEGYDSEGNLVASDEVVLNQPRGSFRVRIVEPRRGAKANGPTTARAEIVLPEERRVEKVEFHLDNEMVATVTKPPWEAEVNVPESAETSYLSAVVILDDGSRAEDVRFLNAPLYLEEVDVDLVELMTTVLDSTTNRPVSGLERESFQVFEDGRPQEIDKFELVEDLPLALGIAIDTSGSMASSLGIAKEAANGFLSKVITSRDRVFALSFAGEPVLLIPPTDDLRAIEASLEGLQSVGWTALHDAVVTSLYYFRATRGRRALILLSDGDDTSSFYAYRDVLEYARRSGVVIYSIGVGVGANVGLRRKLGSLASETGGRAFYIKGIEELTSVYRQIEDELRSQYLLTYTSDNTADRESFREVEVKVKGGRMKARTLRGYYP